MRVTRGVGGAGSQATAPPTPAPLTLGPAAPTVGLVFQFPERHFLGETLVEELTFGWPANPGVRAARGVAAQAALARLGLAGLPLDCRLRGLSGGFQRRVALAVQAREGQEGGGGVGGRGSRRRCATHAFRATSTPPPPSTVS